MKKYRNKVTGVIDRVQNIAIVRMVQGVMGINKDNQLSAFAAQAAFFLLLSFFPLVMLLGTLLPLFQIRVNTIFAGDSGRICGIDRRNHSR